MNNVFSHTIETYHTEHCQEHDIDNTVDPEPIVGAVDSM